MDDYTIEKDDTRKFIAMPRKWLNEAVQIERFFNRRDQYSPSEMLKQELLRKQETTFNRNLLASITEFGAKDQAGQNKK